MRFLKIACLAFVALSATMAFGADEKQGQQDITFVVASDLHYKATDANKILPASIKRINALPGKKYPASVGGIVNRFDAVILNGDLTNRGTETEWKLFVKDWGLLGENRCKFPIYEGFGNHDLFGGLVVSNHIKERNKHRKGLKGVSSNGYHYSWDMGGIHFIQANLVAANFADDPQLPPKMALDFVRLDLEKNVGNSGRPVILNQHYGSTSLEQWPQTQRKALLALLNNYNVIAVFCGHSHGGLMKVNGVMQTNPNYENQKLLKSRIDLFYDGSLRYTGLEPHEDGFGRFFVVHVQGSKMTVIQNSTLGWGKPFEVKFSWGRKASR